MLRPGNAGSNTAADHRRVIDLALCQIPAGQAQGLDLLIRSDSAGATHGLVDYCHQADLRFSVGHDLTEPVSDAILKVPATRALPSRTRRTGPATRSAASKSKSRSDHRSGTPG